MCEAILRYEHPNFPSFDEAAVFKGSRLLLVGDGRYRPGRVGEVWTDIFFRINDSAEFYLHKVMNYAHMIDIGEDFSNIPRYKGVTAFGEDQ